MARTALTAIDAPSAYATAPSTLTFTAGDAVNGNEVTLTGREVLIARNTDGSNPHNITVDSVNCPHGRDGDGAAAIPANGFVIFQQFPTAGWMQSTGKLFVDVDDAQIELAVVKLA